MLPAFNADVIRFVAASLQGSVRCHLWISETVYEQAILIYKLVAASDRNHVTP